MDRLIRTMSAKNSGVLGVSQVKRVVRGVATAMITRILRLLENARVMLVGLPRRLNERPLAIHCLRPFALGTRWSPSPAYAGGAPCARQQRWSRPGSERRVTGFRGF